MEIYCHKNLRKFNYRFVSNGDEIETYIIFIKIRVKCFD